MSIENKNPLENTPHKTGWVRILLQLLFTIIFIGCAVALSKHYLNTPPKAKPKKRTPVAPLVTITTLSQQDIQYEFDAMGTVVSARRSSPPYRL